jgi:hypothetical protein
MDAGEALKYQAEAKKVRKINIYKISSFRLKNFIRNGHTTIICTSAATDHKLPKILS